MAYCMYSVPLFLPQKNFLHELPEWVNFCIYLPYE